MKPLGRKYYKDKTSKSNDRFPDGELNWWEVVCKPNKKRHRQESKNLCKECEE